MIRLVLPLHLSNLASASREITLEVAGCCFRVHRPGRTGSPLPHAARHHPRPGHADSGDRSSVFLPAGRIYRWIQPTDPLPEEVASGKEPLRVVGAMAGG